MHAMSLNFALAQKENTSFTVDMRVIFHMNDTLNDSQKFLMQVYEHVYLNYTQIYFSYSTVTSACQESRLTCTRAVSIFRTLTYMQTHFRH